MKTSVYAANILKIILPYQLVVRKDVRYSKRLEDILYWRMDPVTAVSDNFSFRPKHKLHS
jgi:hypothetical protein